MRELLRDLRTMKWLWALVPLPLPTNSKNNIGFNPLTSKTNTNKESIRLKNLAEEKDNGSLMVQRREFREENSIGWNILREPRAKSFSQMTEIGIKNGKDMGM